MIKGILSGVVALLMAVGTMVMPATYNEQAIGGVDVRFVQTQPFYLAGSGAALGATSITLKSFTQLDGTALTMSNFGSKGFATIEPNNSVKEEAITFTGVTQNANGTATLTGVKSQETVYPYTETSGLAKSHAGSVKLVITNTAGMYNTLSVWANDGTITGDWTFASTSIPVYDAHPTFTVGTQLIDKTYADGLVAAGVATSSETNFGGVWLATQLQQASSTDGSPNAPYVLQSKNATSTWNSATAGLMIPVSQNNGKLDQGWLDLSEIFTFTGNNTFSGNNSFSGTSLFTASSTFTATTSILANSLTNNALRLNGLAYQMPSSRGASSTVPFEDGTGNITWQEPSYPILLTSVASTTTGALKFSADSVASAEGTSYTKEKEILIRNGGQINVSYAIRSSSSGQATVANIYVNGVAVGTERSYAVGIGYVYYDETIDIQPYDKVQLYLKTSSGSYYGKDFRIYYTKSLTGFDGVVNVD
jgi:hypothetical protein